MTKKLDTNNWAFETKQLHIGQEISDPITNSRAVPIIKRPLMYLIIAKWLLIDLP